MENQRKLGHLQSGRLDDAYDKIEWNQENANFIPCGFNIGQQRHPFPMTKTVFPRFASLMFLVIMIVHILSLAAYLIFLFPILQILLAPGILPLQLNQFNALMLQKPDSIWSSRSSVIDDLMEIPRGHTHCLMKLGLLNT